MTQPNKITNLFGYCGIRIYYEYFLTQNITGKILTNIYGKQVGHFTDAGYDIPTATKAGEQFSTREVITSLI